jgi:hypothetical protein
VPKRFEINFEPYSCLGGKPRVEWRVAQKTGSLYASGYGLHYDEVFRVALDLDALDHFVNMIFCAQAGTFKRAKLSGSGMYYHGTALDATLVPVLAQGIALHYVAALQRMLAARGDPDDEWTWDRRLQWQRDTEWLRDTWAKKRHGITQAQRALAILSGERRDGERLGRKSLTRFELLPFAYTHDLRQKRLAEEFAVA